jgi:periplasmic divalent cation tolerance protein
MRLCERAGPHALHYRWSAAVEEAEEIPALFKTTADAAPVLKARILALHPYENACVLMIPVAEAGSSRVFTDWVRQGVTLIHE